MSTPFTRAEALAAGWTARRLDGAVRRKELQRIVPGLYADHMWWSQARPWERHRALAVAAARTTPDAILSHASAASLLDLPMPASPPARATMTLLDDRRTSEGDAWRRFHRGATPSDQILITAGVPHLVPARTVIDCVRELPPQDALAVVDGALRRRLVTTEALEAMRRHQTRWPGIASAGPVLDLADPRRESWLESVSAWCFRSWAIPPGVPQVVVRDLDGSFVARVDSGWVELGLVGEADGRGKYLADKAPGEDDESAAAHAVVAQVVRENRLRDLGLEVVRWDTGDVRSRPLELRAWWLAAVHRAQPGRVRARFECSCCARPLTDCGYATANARLLGF